jgi:uncharacterized protein (TIGR03067 family)
MKWCVLAAVAAGLSVGADAKDDAVKADLEKLKGTWALVSAERDGKKAPEDEVKKTRITFKGDQFLFPDESGVATSKKGTIKIDPSKKPKAMDAIDDGPDGKTSLGIYAIDGDDYKVCFAPPGKERPAEFGSKPGSGNIYQVWKRAKP